MKVLAKILLGFALFAVVVAVSYLKTDLQGKSIDEKIDSRLNPVAVSLEAQSEPTIAIDQEQATTADAPEEGGAPEALDTLTPTEASTETAPELPAEESQESQESPEQPKSSDTQSSEPEEKQPDPPPAAPEPEKDPRQEIIDFFQSRLDDLPDDLTSYEKKVAIKEIRDDVCERYKITRAKLNSLSQEYKIHLP